MHFSDLESLPNDPFFMIVTRGSTYVPADARSVEAPGHGFPRYFTDEEEWRTEIQKLATPAFGAPIKFRAYRVSPANVSVEVRVA